MTLSALSESLRQLGDFAEIRGASADAAAWRRLATEIDRSPGEIERLRRHGGLNRLSELAGFHTSLLETVHDVLVDGTEPALQAARSHLPWLVRAMLDHHGIDTKTAAALSRQGIVTLPDLAVALDAGRVDAQFPRYANALRSVAQSLHRERPRLTLGRAVELIEGVAERMRSVPGLERVTPAGDVRRIEPIVASLAIVAQSTNPGSAIDAVLQMPGLSPLHRADGRVLVEHQQAEIDLRFAAPGEFGTALYATTGPPAHLEAVRTRRGRVGVHAREEDIYAEAGLAWIPPELRRGSVEIQLAAERKIPKLVARDDIRGDLHLHTTYSDGRDTLAEMIAAAAALGYEYIAITDHSERAAATRTLSRTALARQRDEIAHLRERFPGLTILHGAEVDIMPDGTLDFPDDVLAPLDIVLASLHDSHGHNRDRLTRRCLQAIEHPLVNVITHPANRLVGRDAGYDLDFRAVYAAAAATGTALEIDGAPSHLDLDGERAREAIAAGVTVTIDSDCHRARLLDRQMRLGVGTARRGWVEPQHVLNTRPLGELRTFLGAKRRRR